MRAKALIREIFWLVPGLARRLNPRPQESSGNPGLHLVTLDMRTPKEDFEQRNSLIGRVFRKIHAGQYVETRL